MLDASEYPLFERTLIPYMDGNAPEDSVYGLEIGVLDGETSAFLLDMDNRIWLYGVDPLTPDPVEPSLVGNLDKIHGNTRRFGARWNFIKYWSHGVAHWFDDESLDFVFVDGSHKYDDVLRDFQLYHPKLKVGGLMYFHDSRMNRGGPEFWPGPSQLVDQLIKTNNMVKLIDEEFSMTVFERTY